MILSDTNLIADQVANLDDVTLHFIIKYFDCLWYEKSVKHRIIIINTKNSQMRDLPMKKPRIINFPSNELKKQVALNSFSIDGTNMPNLLTQKPLPQIFY